MPRIVAAAIYRLESSGTLTTLGACTRENDTGANLFTTFNIPQLLAQRAHLHFNNKDYIELDKFLCFFSVLVGDNCTLLFVCICELAITSIFMDNFVTIFQASIINDKRLVSRFTAAIKPKFLKDLSSRIAQFLMEHGNEGEEEVQPNRLAEIRQQVEEVKTVMTNNVQRVLERGERLEDIEGRTEALTQSSQNFKFTARRIQRRMCLRNAKWTIIIAVCVTIVVIIIILIILNDAGVFNPK